MTTEEIIRMLQRRRASYLRDKAESLAEAGRHVVVGRLSGLRSAHTEAFRCEERVDEIEVILKRIGAPLEAP